MQTPSTPQSIPLEPEIQSEPHIKDIAKILRLIGSISFWIELGLAAVCVLTLLFAITGRNFSEESSHTLGIAIFWAIGSILALSFNIYLAFRFTRLGKGLLTLTPELAPKKADITRLLRLGVIVSLVGIFLSLVGSGVSISVLVAKILSQPTGVALAVPNQIIQGLDVFTAMANVNGIAAHFVGVIASIWLLDQVHRH